MSFDLVSIFLSVIEIVHDEKYGIKFKSGEIKVLLVIEIGPEFPYKHPKLTLEPNLVHPWIEDGIISSPGLLNVSCNWIINS